MRNKGLFSTLYIEALTKDISLSDTARGRMATLAQLWRTHRRQDATSLWESFLKQALSYLEFVSPTSPDPPNVYSLYEDWGFSNCITVLYLVEPGENIDNTTVGRFYPAKLIAQLRKRKLNWGILTDGACWRLYSTKSSRPYEDFVELSLEEALETDNEAEYGLFERFFHRDSFVAEEIEKRDKDTGQAQASSVYKCRLDQDREKSEQLLEEKVKKPFLDQVDEVLRYICNGFIFDTKKSGQEYTEKERAEIFESAVKLIYRCLFLFYAEARKLLPSNPEKAELYKRHSIQALCQEAWKFRWGKRHDTDEYDLWKHLKGLVAAVNDGDPEYGIMGHNGGLFDDEEEKFLGQHQLRNDFLSRALYLLAYVDPYDNAPEKEYPIPYEDLEVQHLGELYENILEYTVKLADSDRIRRRTKNGVEYLLASQTQKRAGDTLIKKGEVYFDTTLKRKQTGSYYTPEPLVRFINEKTIIKPLKEIFKQNYRARFNEFLKQLHTAYGESRRRGAAQSAVALIERFVEEEVLNFKVCDPAMGSGHFLVNAANQMAGLVVSLLEKIPYVEGVHVSVTSSPNDWRRRITRHCLYGVDINPLAVNLAKLSLWLNCFASDHKLTFLDHHLRCGNSLIGIRSLEQLKDVPQRKKKRKKRKLQENSFMAFISPNYRKHENILIEMARDITSISEVHEDDTDEQKEIFDKAIKKSTFLRPLADLYTSYLMDPKISPDDYFRLLKIIVNGEDISSQLDPVLDLIWKSVERYSERHRFFHWPLEFPEVFGPGGVGGFSATVGNPPWDIVKPNSQEFFSAYDPKFRSHKKQEANRVSKKQEANRVSKKLMADNPGIAKRWQEYCGGFIEQSTYFREPLNYRALGKGDINTFKLFLEQFFTVLKDGGHMGIVVPSGIYTDKGCQPLRELFFNQSRIKFLYCFENRNAIFNIHRSFKFVLFGTQKGGKTDRFKCAFMEHDPERLPAIDTNALKMSVKQVRKFSPDTLSIMEFKSQRDIDVTTKIYGDWPLLGEKLESTWNVKFRRELDMTNHSHLFKTTPTDCPLYEGKMIWLFDSAFEQPRYWLDKDEVEEALGVNAWEGKHYRVGFRDIAASTNERTLISTVIPKCFHGNKIPTVTPANDSDKYPGPNDSESLWLTSALCSFVVDFLIRQKISTTLNYFYMYALPVPRMFGNPKQRSALNAVKARCARLICGSNEFSDLWKAVFQSSWQSPDFWYPPSAAIDNYGPIHEQEIRKRLRDEAKTLTPEWGPHCGVHDRLPDRRDTGDRAQLRAEIDAYVAHLYGLSRDDFAYILDTFPVLKKKEEKAFGEFMSKRKCLEEYDRIKKIMNAEG